MKKKDLVKLCLVDKDSIETYPFSDDLYKEMPIMRHKSNNKWYGVIYELDNKLYINLKASPETIIILKEEYPEIVTSAWHMNKKHWYKVEVNKIAKDELKGLIQMSFDITSKVQCLKRS